MSVALSWRACSGSDSSGGRNPRRRGFPSVPTSTVLWVILAAALLVLVALALFVGGIATGATALYWACVAISAAAAVLLVVARLQQGRLTTGRPAGSGGDSHEIPQRGVHDGVHGEDASRGRGPGTHVAPAFAPDPVGGRAQPPAEPTTDDGDLIDREEPAVEEVEVSDLLLVVDLRTDVLVVDEHPRYHLADCPYLRGRSAIPVPVDEARTDGFTPCALCAPDRHLAAIERGRRGRGSA
jgi:hypothetical protein